MGDGVDLCWTHGDRDTAMNGAADLDGVLDDVVRNGHTPGFQYMVVEHRHSMAHSVWAHTMHNLDDD